MRNSGDDMIAVVTYQYMPNLTHEILIENNDLSSQPWGRGIAFAGGEKVTIRNNKISYTSGAGIYLAAESAWNTWGVNNVLVTNNIIDHAPNTHPENGQSSILAFGDNAYPIQNVTIRHNTITNAPNGAIRISITKGWNIGCRGNTLNGMAVTPSDCSGNTSGVTGTSITSRLLGGGPVRLPQ